MIAGIFFILLFFSNSFVKSIMTGGIALKTLPACIGMNGGSAILEVTQTGKTGNNAGDERKLLKKVTKCIHKAAILQI